MSPAARCVRTTVQTSEHLVAAALPGFRLVGVAVMGLLLLVLALVLTGLLLPARVAAAANRTVSPNILFFLADGAGQLAVHAALL
eukprot:SAG25_NODE_3249_length_1157_cov_1.783554_1_plen_85_part_00